MGGGVDPRGCLTVWSVAGFRDGFTACRGGRQPEVRRCLSELGVG